jgi:hypothetical protein
MRTRPIPAHSGETSSDVETSAADHNDSPDHSTAREGADAQLEQDWSRRRRTATQNTSTASRTESSAGADPDDLARSRREAERAAAAARPTPGPSAPHR